MKLLFLMITSVTDTEKIIEAFEIGVDQFISKPLRPPLLDPRLR